MHEAGTHWRTALWRQASVSLPGLGTWVAVGVALWAGLYFVLEGRVAFFAVAEDPLWWIERVGGALIAWIVFDIDEYKPRWRSIPTILIPIAGFGLCAFSLLGKHPGAWPIVIAIALLAFGLDWLLIRRWRVYYAVQQRAQTAAPAAIAPAVPG
ncbi:MAG: hypothetical protein QM783_19625 [Phycisphaerales bacterium]